MADWRVWILIAAAAVTGCKSPHAQDRLAAAGAGLGGVTGAIVGAQRGNAAQGALIGAALGTAAGAITGAAIDDAEARNRAEIAARLGRPAPRGAVSLHEVVAMVQAGVPEAIVVSHVQRHGMSQPIGTAELIHMQQQGVPQRVMAAAQRGVIQAAHVSAPRTVIVERPRPTTVIVERPCCHHREYYYHHRHHHPHVGFGFSSCHDW